MYGKNATIKVQGVTDALASISKTIQLAGKPSPLYREEVKYQLIIQSMVEVYQRADPPSMPQLVETITVTQHCFKAALLSSDAIFRTVGCLAIIAFFYLLRVGEYTKPLYVI